MLSFAKSLDKALKNADAVLVIASESLFQAGTPQKTVPHDAWNLLAAPLAEMKPGAKPQIFRTFTGQSGIKRFTAAVLPARVSRGHSPTRRPWIFQASEDLDVPGKTAVVLLLDDASHYQAAAGALARRVRTFTRKTAPAKDRDVAVVAFDAQGAFVEADDRTVATAEAVTWACHMVDMPPTDLGPRQFAKEITKLFKGNDAVSVTEISGEELRDKGFGGIWEVGKTAEESPRLLILEHKPKGAQKTVALLGKGITYDTGGLTLKVRPFMVGMKCDMGGAAAVVGAFKVLVDSACPHRVYALVAIAENAIGPKSLKNDDIITLYSGKTVEVNNTDAEGRLLLGDCMAYASKHLKPDLIIDAATLTGAQATATGQLHAGIVSNDDAVEALALRVAKDTGDLAAPLPFAPEFFNDEFQSPVADMKNSVTDAANAPSSCAGQFIFNHIADESIPWLHVDLAAPAFSKKSLGTGYGITLISETARRFGQ